MGKAVTVGGGTGNTLVNNKWDAGDYTDYTTTEKTKLEGIATGANKYVHPTTAGNNHIPTGGAANQVLKYSANGTAVWGTDKDTVTTIANNLTETVAGKALDATQGAVLVEQINACAKMGVGGVIANTLIRIPWAFIFSPRR